MYLLPQLWCRSAGSGSLFVASQLLAHMWVSCCQVGQAAALHAQAFVSARGGWGRPLNCLDSWPFLWTPSPGPGAEAWGLPHLRMLPGSLGRHPAPCDSEAQMRWRGERETVC